MRVRFHRKGGKMAKREKLQKVFEAIKDLSEDDKYWLIGYFGLAPDLEKFDKKIKLFLGAH